MPKKSEGGVRPGGERAPVDVDALLYQAMGDPAILTPELAASIERVLDRVVREDQAKARQPQHNAAGRKVEKERSTMT